MEHKPLLLKSICALSIVLSSLAAQATDRNVAVVQAMRTAWLNGVAIPRVSAIFPGDIVQTKTDLADIDAFGSKVLVLGDSLLTYQGDGVELERGGVSVGTSKALSAKVGGLTVRPAAATWTEFQISNADETVHIVATKGDLILADENGTTTLNAGQETTREQAPRKRKKRSAGAIPAAQKSVMDKTTAMYIGGAAAGGVITWVLLQQEDPISPDKP